MKKIFECLRSIRLAFRVKKQKKKWLIYVESYCSRNSKFQWCQLTLENFQQIRKNNNVNQQTLKQLRSTNISSQIIKAIRKDYELNQTPFNLLVQIFTTYVNHKYFDVVNPTQVTVTKICTDTQNFIDFMRSLIVIYYGLQQRELIGDDQFFRVTLSNFISECIFSREQFNSCVILIIKNTCKQSQDRISFNIQKYKNLQITEYEINSKYTLNKQTLRLYECQHHSMQMQQPYIGPIKIIKQTIKAKTPIQKVKCIENLIQQIQFSITKFYEDNKINSKIYLDADNAIAILLYILVQSEQSQLLTHLNIIYNFLNKQSLEDSSKFCLDTLKACLQFLEKGSIKKNKGFNVQESQFSLWLNAQSYFENTSSK